MFKKTLIAALFMASATIASAHSEEAPVTGPYIGASYSLVSVKNTFISGTDVRLSTVGALVGYDFNANFALEARVAAGVGHDTISLLGSDLTVKFNRLAGVYGKWSVPIEPQLDIYALAGLSNGKVKTSLRSMSDTDTHSSGSFGVGLSYQVNRANSVSVEYARLYSNTHAVSITSKFAF